MTERNNIIVSVCMICYNQEKYIRQAIEGIIRQKCTFLFELVIGEDSSTDTTREICKEYSEKYSDIIRLFLTEKNIGGNENFIRTLEKCNGKYIAVCEGDDYWTDCHKLEKQVALLEENTRITACFTNALIMNELDMTQNIYIDGLPEGVITRDRIFGRGGALYPTASILFRKSCLMLNVFKEIKELAGDTLLIMTLAMKGEIYYYNIVTCVYRVWSGGIYSSTRNDFQKIITRKKLSVKGFTKLINMAPRQFKGFLKERISVECRYIIENERIKGNFAYIARLSFKDAIRLFINLTINRTALNDIKGKLKKD
jgi:glycosyltransferase involved in cell wall biosynthesis